MFLGALIMMPTGVAGAALGAVDDIQAKKQSPPAILMGTAEGYIMTEVPDADKKTVIGNTTTNSFATVNAHPTDASNFIHSGFGAYVMYGAEFNVMNCPTYGVTSTTRSTARTNAVNNNSPSNHAGAPGGGAGIVLGVGQGSEQAFCAAEFNGAAVGLQP